jgi:hypothetical protein
LDLRKLCSDYLRRGWLAPVAAGGMIRRTSAARRIPRKRLRGRAPHVLPQSLRRDNGDFAGKGH